MASNLSDTELECIGGDVVRLTTVLTGITPASQKEKVELITCLNDETLTRFLLAGFISKFEPFSPETSACVREAFDVINPRKVITAGAQGDSTAFMNATATAFTVTLTCLNDDEWNATATRLGMEPVGQTEMKCVMNALVLQRRFLKLVSFWAQITSRTARLQSCQACGLIAMRRCSRSFSYEPSL